MPEATLAPTAVHSVQSSWNPKSLSARQRLVFRMAAWGLSPAHISEASGYSIEHVYKLLSTDQGRAALSHFRESIESTIEKAVLRGLR